MKLDKIKLFYSLSFFDFLQEKTTITIQDRARIEFVQDKLKALNDQDQENFFSFTIEKNNITLSMDSNKYILGFADVLKLAEFCFIFIASLAYPLKTLKKEYSRLVGEVPPIREYFISQDIDPLSNLEYMSETILGDICRDVMKDCFYDEWLYLDEKNFYKVCFQLPLIAEKIIAVASFFDIDTPRNTFFDSFVAYANYQNSAKGGVIASLNRKEKEKELRLKAINMYMTKNPKSGKRWKSRNEFYDYFVMITNKCIDDENEWIKTSTVKRWITEHLENYLK